MNSTLKRLKHQNDFETKHEYVSSLKMQQESPKKRYSSIELKSYEEILPNQKIVNQRPLKQSIKSQIELRCSTLRNNAHENSDKDPLSPFQNIKLQSLEIYSKVGSSHRNNSSEIDKNQQNILKKNNFDSNASKILKINQAGSITSRFPNIRPPNINCWKEPEEIKSARSLTNQMNPETKDCVDQNQEVQKEEPTGSRGKINNFSSLKNLNCIPNMRYTKPVIKLSK